MDYKLNLNTGDHAYYLTDHYNILEVFTPYGRGSDCYSCRLYDKFGETVKYGSIYFGSDMQKNHILDDMGETLVENLGKHNSINDCITNNKLPERDWYAKEKELYGNWVGSIVIKPQPISLEDYCEYFSGDGFTYEEVQEIMGRGEMAHARILDDLYRSVIRNKILDGKFETFGRDMVMPDWKFTVECSLDGKHVSFGDLNEQTQKDILDSILWDHGAMGEICETVEIAAHSNTLDALISEAEQDASAPGASHEKQRDTIAR